MKRSRFISLFLFSLSFAISLGAQTTNIEAHRARRAVAESFPNAYLRWDDGTGSLAMMAGLRVPGPFGTPARVAEAFIHEHRELLGLSGNVKYARHQDTPSGGRRIFFQQYEDGIPVPGSGILIGVSRELPGERTYVDKGGNRAPPGFVFVTSSERRDFEEERGDWFVYSYTRSVPARVSLLASHKFEGPAAGIASSRTPGTRPVINLKIAKSTCPVDDYSFTGTGRVFPTNPNLSNPRTLPLRDLCSQSPYILDGSWLSVIPESGTRVSDPAGLFSFDPSSPEFDEVSAYFHIENFLRMLFERGFAPSSDENWKILAEVRSARDVTASADYPTVTLTFGDPGPPYRNVLMEAAVIAHETLHLVMHKWYSSSFLGVGNKEHWAMGEAYADYFALVYRSGQIGHWEPWLRPEIGSYYVLTATEDEPRDLSSSDPHFSGYGTATYAGNGIENSLYDNSMIFSTALLDYDRFDGSVHSSSFVLESLTNASDGPNFLKGRDALIQAVQGCATIPYPDQEICCDSGNCQAAVIEAFSRRGIGTIDDVAVQQTAQIPDHRVRMIGIFPNPFRESVNIEFETDSPSHTQMRIFDALGILVETLVDGHLPAGTHSVSWRPSGATSGTYYVEIATAGAVLRLPVTLLR